MKDLPVEVLYSIFRKLSRSDLQNCMYVCKLWNPPSTIEFFKVFELTTKKILYLRNNLLLECESTVDFKPKKILKNAGFIQCLKFSKDEGLDRLKYLHEVELRVLLHNTRSLREIDLSETTKCAIVLKLLVDAVKISNYYGYPIKKQNSPLIT